MKKKKLAITLILLAVVIAAIAIGISISGDDTQSTEANNGGNQGEVSFEVTAPPNETNSTENTEEMENGSG